MIDLRPAVRRTGAVVAAVPDDLLAVITPTGATVAELINHVGGLALAFRAAALKEFGPLTDLAPGVSGNGVEPGWRDRTPLDLGALGDAWGRPEAWTGMTRAGGIDLPGEVAGLVALDEVVIHGWDLAVATGQDYELTDQELKTTTNFVAAFDVPRDGSMFGPIVEVPDSASPLDRLLGLTGRDPAWRPPS